MKTKQEIIDMVDKYEGSEYYAGSVEAFMLALEWTLGLVSTEMCVAEMDLLSETHLQGNHRGLDNE